MQVASRFIRSATYIQSLGTGTPAVASEPVSIHCRKKSTSGKSASSRRPAARKKLPRYLYYQKLPKLPQFKEPSYKPTLITPTLTFSFEEAKSHLIKADTRFEQLFANSQCKPFEQLEPVDPFRALVTAVMGHHRSQVIAKAIHHRFLRLFNRTLPVELPHKTKQNIGYTFPSPARVAKLDSKTLGTVGMSSLQAEHVLNVAKQFADGRLSAEKLANASDKEVENILTSIQGVGEGTADMFAITTLRRPDIIPVHNQRIQRGLLKWVLSSHEPKKYPLQITPQARKLAEPNKDELGKPEVKPGKPVEGTPVQPTSGGASVSPAKTNKSSSNQQSPVLLVPTSPVKLPEGMTLDTLKARLSGKKATRGRYLLPSEVKALTTDWAPYRSLGAFYMWRLAGRPT
ncbi:DNA-3-methyladenine glycosylase II [Rhizoctonia solani]|uniref:DNA-3-methyladenine glycosylase II n=1 Tax=Rhizoctonia solani TaxID=456999 RepID=A0A0K6FKG4_9AGAM|nr:DNA-3-methyladenine glycosylase II [Rhizoctonia solani]